MKQLFGSIKVFCLLFVLVLTSSMGFSQSLAINNDGRTILEYSDEEKAIKASASLIKAKEDNRWETNLNSRLIQWEVKFIKDKKLYLLYRDQTKIYESTTIDGVRANYKANLLGVNPTSVISVPKSTS